MLTRPIIAAVLTISTIASAFGQPTIAGDTASVNQLAPTTKLLPGELSKVEVIDIPIQSDSIDATQFYDHVLSRLHWTTELSNKLGKELTTDHEPQLSQRISMSAVSIICQQFPTAFEVLPVAVVDGTPPGEPTSVLRVNLKRLQSDWGQQKFSLRKWLSTKSQSPLYEVCGKVGFNTPNLNNQVVMVIPGLQGDAETACQFAEAIHQKTNLAACVFRYPNDAALDESTDYLISILEQWHRQDPNRQFILVTHSMGGLIARSIVEQRMAGAVNCLGIKQVVMICPPNHGSAFAEYAGVLEGAELLQKIIKRKAGRKLIGAILDGFNEAPADLVADSPYLAALNSHQRNPHIKYSIIAGNAGFIDPLFADVGTELIGRLADRAAERAQSTALQQRAAQLLNSPEFRKGTGDGVVGLESAMLPGVEDFVVLPINHLNWAELDKTEGQTVLAQVVKRIRLKF